MASISEAVDGQKVMLNKGSSLILKTQSTNENLNSSRLKQNAPFLPKESSRITQKHIENLKIEKQIHNLYSEHLQPNLEKEKVRTKQTVSEIKTQLKLDDKNIKEL